jgi:hypothetical protein
MSFGVIYHQAVSNVLSNRHCSILVLKSNTIQGTPSSRESLSPSLTTASAVTTGQVAISPHVYGPSVTGATSDYYGTGLWNRLSNSFGYLTKTVSAAAVVFTFSFLWHPVWYYHKPWLYPVWYYHKPWLYRVRYYPKSWLHLVWYYPQPWLHPVWYYPKPW